MRKKREVHGHRGPVMSPEYRVWSSMIQRCENPKRACFPRYGGVGVSVCARWRASFDAFLSDVGPRPQGQTLDRFPDRKGNYEPGNVRWATPREQAFNRDATKLITVGGRSVSLVEYSERTGVSYYTLRQRYDRGLSDAQVASREGRYGKLGHSDWEDFGEGWRSCVG